MTRKEYNFRFFFCLLSFVFIVRSKGLSSIYMTIVQFRAQRTGLVNANIYRSIMPSFCNVIASMILASRTPCDEVIVEAIQGGLPLGSMRCQV